MPASDKEIEEVVDDVIDTNILPRDLQSKPIAKLIVEYTWNDSSKKNLLFPFFDYKQKKILLLAEYAGPLNQFERLIRELITQELTSKTKTHWAVDKIVKVGNRSGTLLQCLLSGLDQTIKNNYGTHILGMANCLMEIVKELLPSKSDDMLMQAKQVIPAYIESDAEKTNREAQNVLAVESLFYELKRKNQIEDDQIIVDAMENFKQFVQRTRQFSFNEQGLVTNGLYFFNLIHLISTLLYKFYEERSYIASKVNYNLFVKQGLSYFDFFHKMVGELQRDLPPRAQQFLRKNLQNAVSSYYCQDKREMDFYSERFYYGDFEEKLELGVNFSYGSIEVMDIVDGQAFKNYYDQLYRHSGFGMSERNESTGPEQTFGGHFSLRLR